MRRSRAGGRRTLGGVVVVALIAAGLTSAAVSPAAASGGAVRDLDGCTANTLPRNDDGSTSRVSTGFDLNFFGHQYTSLFVNNNGNVTFDAPQSTYTPYSLREVGRVIVAPFFADVDTRGAGSLQTTYGQTTVDGHQAFCVNWVQVGYYNYHTDKLNSFQLLLVDRNDNAAGDFDIAYNYGQVQWETGDASGGYDGVGGSPARVGFSNGSDHSFELAGSGHSGAFLDSNTDTGLIHNARSSDQPGRYVFHVRNGNDDAEARLYANSTLGGGNPVIAVAPPCAGDPVDCATGEWWTTASDVSLRGRGPVTAVTRTFNSSVAGTTGVFGYGWSSLFDTRIAVSGSTATVIQENGSQTPFTSTDNVNYTAPSYVLATLHHESDGTWTYVRRHRDTLTFDAQGHLLNVRDLHGNTLTIQRDSSGTPTVLATDDGRRVVVNTDAAGRITSMTDPAGRSTRYTYDNSGNLASVTDPVSATSTYSYDDQHRVITSSPAVGGPLQIAYGSSGRVSSVTAGDGAVTNFTHSGSNGDGTTTITDPDGRSTLEEFSGGLLTRRTVTGGSTSATTTYTHEPATLAVATVTDPLGRTTRYGHDAANTTSITTAGGHTSTATYDTLGDPLTVTDAVGNTRTSTWSSAGDLLTRKTTTASGQPAKLTQQHAANGDLLSVTDPNGHTTTYTYDSAGRLTSTTQPEGEKTASTYDAAGDLTAFADALGRTAHITYDRDDRPTQITDLGGSTVRTIWDGTGRMTSRTDADGNTTRYAYDAAGRLTVTTRADNSTLKDAYDTAGRLALQTDGAGHTTRYNYDSLGNLTSITGPSGEQTNYQHDLGGQVTQQTLPTGEQTAYTWNPDGLLASSSTGSSVVNFTYDAAGHRTGMSDATGTSSWSYDPAGRLLSNTDGSGSTVTYRYDPAGQLAALTYPDGSSTARSYDSDGRIASVTDPNGRQFTFGYDADSNLTSQSAPNGVTTAITVDARGATTGIDIRRGSSSLTAYKDTRDAAGLVTSETATGSANPGPRNLSYDTLGELLAQSSGPKVTAGSLQYRYDGSGTVTGTAGPGNHSTTLTYTDGGVLRSLSTGTAQSNSAAGATYTGDSAGERTSVNSSAGVANYTWTGGLLANYSGPLGGPASGLETVTASTSAATSTVTTQYAYDGLGLRTSKTSANSSHFTYDDAEGAPVMLSDGTYRFVYGPDGHVIEQFGSSGAAQYLHQDQLGSTRLVTDAQGNVAGAYNYTPYGSLLQSSKNTSATAAATQTPVLYAGGYRDSESGLYWLHARMYDPATAQFLSRDPLASLTWTPYSYANSSPLTLTDPLGLCSLGCVFGWVGVGVAVVGLTVVTAGVGDVALGTLAGVGGAFGAVGAGEVTTGVALDGLAVGAGAFATGYDCGHEIASATCALDAASLGLGYGGLAADIYEHATTAFLLNYYSAAAGFVGLQQPEGQPETSGQDSPGSPGYTGPGVPYYC